MKICFICHANICRSFIAQELMHKLIKERGLAAEVFSRGIYADSGLRPPAKVIDFLKEAGITPAPHIPTLVSAADMARADIILVMEQRQLDYLKDLYAQYSDKMFLLRDYAFGEDEDVDDPMGLNGHAFTKAARAIENAVKSIADKLFK